MKETDKYIGQAQAMADELYPDRKQLEWTRGFLRAMNWLTSRDGLRRLDRQELKAATDTYGPIGV